MRPCDQRELSNSSPIDVASAATRAAENYLLVLQCAGVERTVVEEGSRRKSDFSFIS